FAKDLSKFHPHAFISCTKRREAGKMTTIGGWGKDWGRSWGTRTQQVASNTIITDKKRFAKDLISNVEGAMAFLANHLNLSHEFTDDSMRRKEVLEIPPLALREALVNAVVHRDYSDRGQNVFVKVYDDRVEISNPGGFLPGMDNENFREFSQHRNPIIARLMSKASYVEGEATGIIKMEELTTKAGLPVEFIIDAYRWRVCFPRKDYRSESAEHSFNFNDKSLTPRRALRIVRVLYGIHAGKFMKDEFAKHLGVSTRTITEDLKYLTSKKLIAFSGSNQTGRYVVTKKFLKLKH
ncbi:MAG: hypothetical protein OYH77_05735, partial [Pseudomonadota bacterium]|nr:hypothetical protein [Pseudomonadota bacterium]